MLHFGVCEGLVTVSVSPQRVDGVALPLPAAPTPPPNTPLGKTPPDRLGDSFE